MNLIKARTSNRDAPGGYGLTDYLGWMQYSAGGNSYNVPVQTTYGSMMAEPIDSNFEGYIAGAYKANGVVFACELARLMAFTEARFQWRQRARNSRPARTFTDASLALLEKPWAGGVTGDLLARLLLYADFAGNAFVTIIDGELTILRPDRTQIALSPRFHEGGQVGWKKQGYLYTEPAATKGGTGKAVAFLPHEVAHFAPIPDPTATFRGMSWLTPIVREIQADGMTTRHKLKFFENAATPNLVVKLDPKVTPEKFTAFVDKMEEQHAGGTENAYKNLYLGGGADATVVGGNLKEVDFKATQGAGETRIAAAAGVPPVIVGLSEGLQAATYSNYGQARRRYADGTIRPLWRNVAASLEVLFPPPDATSELWYDDADIPFLREDLKDLADITFTQSQAIRALTDGGFDPDAAVAAVLGTDLNALKGQHSGLFSVQLQPAGTQQPTPKALPPAPKRYRIARDSFGRPNGLEEVAD